MTCVEDAESTRVSASMLPGVAQLGTEFGVPSLGLG